MRSCYELLLSNGVMTSNLDSCACVLVNPCIAHRLRNVLVKSELDNAAVAAWSEMPVGLVPPCLHFSVHPVVLLEWLLG